MKQKVIYYDPVDIRLFVYGVHCLASFFLTATIFGIVADEHIITIVTAGSSFFGLMTAYRVSQIHVPERYALAMVRVNMISSTSLAICFAVLAQSN